MPKQVLQLDLSLQRVLHATGYAATSPVQLDGRCVAAMRHDEGTRTFFLRGVFHGWTCAELLRHLRGFDPNAIGPWASRIDGDFNAVVWERAAEVATAISDRVGAHRLYAHCARGIATFTNRLLDQACLQAAPRLDETGAFTLLALQFPLDPYSLLADTFVVALGDIARCDRAGAHPSRYYEPVDLQPALHRDEKPAIGQLDAALTRCFERRLSASTTPLVMLSGGIDSLVMTRYLARLAGDRLETLTFAVEGQDDHELVEARIAARYYGTRHHELVIPRRDVERLYLRSLAETDRSTYGGVNDIAILEALERDGRSLDVFRGEDTRLHTPSIDAPTLLGLLLHRSRLPDSALFRGLWQWRQVARRWPFRRGRNYLAYLLRKTDLRPDVSRYVLEAMTRFGLPDGLEAELPPPLVRAVEPVRTARDLDQLYRSQVALAYRLQYTEDMHAACIASEGANSHLIAPFYVPEVVEASNRVPLSLSLRPLYVGRNKTRSPFPFAEKYVLRKLLASDAPEDLLYRRKAARAARGPFLAELWDRVLVPLIAELGPAVETQLAGLTREIFAAYRQQMLAQGAMDRWTLGRESALLALAQLARTASR